MKITRQDKLEDMAYDILGQEIVRELMREEGAPTDDAFIQEMWEKCKPNAWDAPIIWRLQQILSSHPI